MDIIATQRFVRISPKKMRVVADVARKLAPLETLEKLPFLRKRGSDELLKVIKSAFTNAKQKGLSDDDLTFKEIQIGEGPRLKRGRAASRGRWHPFKKRMSHIRVVLQTADRLQSTAKDAEGNKVTKESEKPETTQEAMKKPLKSNIIGKVKKAVVGRRKAVSK